MESISDDELQRLRRHTTVMEDAGYSTGTYRIHDIVHLLARLDASESRVAELQREVERLNAAACKECGGKGSVDSGGFTEWGSPIEIPCQFCGEIPPC